jgi:hypothetical protein
MHQWALTVPSLSKVSPRLEVNNVCHVLVVTSIARILRIYCRKVLQDSGTGLSFIKSRMGVFFREMDWIASDNKGWISCMVINGGKTSNSPWKRNLENLMKALVMVELM